VGEFVPGYEASYWAGIGAPKATPAEIVEKLNKEINAGLADPKIKARLPDLGGDVLWNKFAAMPAARDTNAINVADRDRANCGKASLIAQPCPLSRANRKTCALSEYYWF
jgi:Tripartite tricarboxylate transporter family receptor